MAFFKGETCYIATTYVNHMEVFVSRPLTGESDAGGIRRPRGGRGWAAARPKRNLLPIRRVKYVNVGITT